MMSQFFPVKHCVVAGSTSRPGKGDVWGSRRVLCLCCGTKSRRVVVLPSGGRLLAQFPQHTFSSCCSPGLFLLGLNKID